MKIFSMKYSFCRPLSHLGVYWFRGGCIKSIISDLIPSQNLMEDGIEPRQTCRNFPKGVGEQVCDIGIGTCIYPWFPPLRSMSAIIGLARESCL